MRDASGDTTAVDLSGQQYLDYSLVSTTYSSQGKTADQVLVAVDSTISQEGLYVAVSRAKQKLSLYTASKEKLLKQAERSTAKENPSDYLTLFNLVNPDAQNEKTAGTAREVRGADQSEYVGDRTGERVAISHRAAVRRDSAAQSRSEPVEDRASRLPPEYVSDVRGVVAGIAERRRIEALERQAERIGEAAQGIISGAGQLELTAAAVDRLNDQLEQKAGQLRGVTKSIAVQKQPVQGYGVAEVILRRIDPDALARYQAQIAEARATEPPIEKKQAAEQAEKRRRRRQIYQQYAAKFVGKSVYERDRLVVGQLMSDLLEARGGWRLSHDEIGKVGRILLEGPVAQDLKQTQGKVAGLENAMEVLAKVQQVVEKAQRCSRDQGMEL